MSGRSDVIEFSLSNQHAIFSNGTTTQEEFYLIRNPENSFKYRGFMVQVEDSKYWYDADKCFVSEPLAHTYSTYRNGGEEGEVWFTESHKHDIGAIQYNWYYMLPLAHFFLGDRENLLVN